MMKRKVYKIDVGVMSRKDAMNTIDPTGRMWKQYKLEMILGTACFVCFIISVALMVI